jgi:outer membrane autotransporter protein
MVSRFSGGSVSFAQYFAVRSHGRLICVSRIVAFTTIGLGSLSAAQAACVLTGGSDYLCSGTVTAPQNFNLDNTYVAAAQGFNLSTSAAALTIQGNGALEYSDIFSSPIMSTGSVAIDVDATGNAGATAGSVTISTAGAITAQTYGIAARNSGSGSTEIIAVGPIVATGAASYGIEALDDQNATSMTILAHDTAGTEGGIIALNDGTGALLVSSTGSAVATSTNALEGIGINADNQSGTDLTLNAVNASGGFSGIDEVNGGTGNTLVTATGTVSGGNTALFTNNQPTANNLTVAANVVTGGAGGIYTFNLGKGTTSVTATGAVDGGSAYGILALNGGVTFTTDGHLDTFSPSNATGVTVQAGSVTGAYGGVIAFNLGKGDLSLTTSGPVTSSNGIGVEAYNFELTSHNIFVQTGAVTGQIAGIVAENIGSGTTQIVALGPVVATGQFEEGISVGDQPGSGSITVIAGDVTADGGAIDVQPQDHGALTIISTGTVTSRSSTQLSTGVSATTFNGNSTDMSIQVVNVSGGYDGIDAFNNGTGNTTVTAAGTVTGGVVGIDAQTGTTGNNLVVTANNVSGGTNADAGPGGGLAAFNDGKGTTVVTATGVVSGGSGYGIVASNGSVNFDSNGRVDSVDPSNATGLTVQAVSVSGALGGVAAYNGGKGDILLTASGPIVSSGGIGVDAYNEYTTSHAVTIAVTSVNAVTYGISSADFGNGATSITATGPVVATGFLSEGVAAIDQPGSTSMTILVGDVTADGDGIDAQPQDTGALTIISTGSVTSVSSVQDGTGISAQAFDGKGTDVTVRTVNASGGYEGIDAYNAGTGDTIVVATGTVTGGAEGLSVVNGNSGNNLVVTVNNVSGGSNAGFGFGSGVVAVNYGKGSSIVTMTGMVSGGIGYGLLTSNGDLVYTNDKVTGVKPSNGTTLTVQAASVSGDITGIAALNGGSGPTSVAVSGDIQGGDSALFVGSTAAISIDIAAGADVHNNSGSAADLAVETITGATAMTNEGTLVGRVLFGDGTFINSGSWTLSGANDLGAGGVLTNTASGVIRAAGSATIANLQTFSNAGTLTMQNGVAGDHLATTGNITMATGSLYAVDIDGAGNADLLSTTGAVTIGGANLSVQASGAEIGHAYAVVTADAGVSGTFGSVTSNIANSAFLGVMTQYDAKNAYVEVERTMLFTDVAVTPNQTSTAHALDILPLTSPIFNDVAQLPDASTARAAFDALSGEIHASIKTALVDDSSLLRDQAINRLDTPTDRGVALWATGLGQWGQSQGDRNAVSIHHETSGILGGADLSISDGWRAGVLGGATTSTFDVRQRVSRGSADSYHLAAYTGGSWDAFAFDVGAAYSWHSIGTVRLVDLPTLSNSLTALYNATTLQLFGEVGYRLDFDPLQLEPFVNLAYVDLQTGGFDERGGDAALHGSSDVNAVTLTTVGAHARTSFNLAGCELEAKTTLGWRHAEGDTTPLAHEAFDGADLFAIAGAPLSRNAGIVDVGLETSLTASVHLDVNYSGQFAQGISDNGLRGTVSVQF